MQASGKTIGILSAVVLGGLGLWYMTKDDDETLEDTTTTPGVAPSPPDTSVMMETGVRCTGACQ